MKRKGKRLAALALALCLLLAAPVNASALMAFVTDVPEPWNGNTLEFRPGDPWYSEAVYRLYYAGIVSSTGSGRFEPDKPVTKGQFVTFLGRLAESQKEHSTDIDYNYLDHFAAGEADLLPDYARPYIQWALGSGILSGSGYGKMTAKELQAPLSRQEMACLLQRFSEDMGTEIPFRECLPPTDLDSAAPWARSALTWAFYSGSQGILRGQRVHLYGTNEDGVIADGWPIFIYPKKTATRAEAAQAIYNYVEEAELELPFLSDMPQ